MGTPIAHGLIQIIMLTLEEQKEDLINTAKEKFGADFFDNLDTLIKECSSQTKMQEYYLTSNYQGAFYAN